MEQDEKVEFDMSFSTNNRINFLLWRANQAMDQDDALEWLKVCKNLLKEANVDDKEYEAFMKEMKDIEAAYAKFSEYINNYQLNKLQKVRMPFVPPRQVYDLLYEMERRLRKRFDKMGLLFRKGDQFAI